MKRILTIILMAISINAMAFETSFMSASFFQNQLT